MKGERSRFPIFLVQNYILTSDAVFVAIHVNNGYVKVT